MLLSLLGLNFCAIINAEQPNAFRFFVIDQSKWNLIFKQNFSNHNLLQYKFQ